MNNHANFDRSVVFRLSVLLFLALAMTVSPIHAGWISKNVYGKRITSLAIDPLTPQTIYCGLYPDSPGSNGVIKSTDGGDTWSSVNQGLNLGGTTANVATLAIDPFNSQILYAGGASGVFKSTDGGNHWSSTGFHQNISVIAIDPVTPTTLYAGISNGSVHGLWARVFKSTDGGNSWIETGYTGGDQSSVWALVISASVPTTIYAGLVDPIGGDGGLIKSVDGGSTWTGTGLIRSIGSAVNGNSIAVDLSFPETIYVGTEEGIFKSTDGGVEWIHAGSINDSINALVIDPSMPTTIYAGAYQNGVLKSIDGGNSWQSTGLYLASYALAIASTTPKTLYAGTADGVWSYRPDCTMLSLNPGGATTCQTDGDSEITTVGYAKVSVNSGQAPYSTAIFRLKQNGVTITEAAVPPSPNTTHAQIFVDYRTNVNAIPARSDAGRVDVNTGIALENNGTANTNITYTLRSQEGVVLATGHGTMAPGKHYAKFIDQLQDVASDFGLPPDFQSVTQFGSLEISSDQPIAVLAIRGTMNQRNEFLITTTPVADLTQSTDSNPIYFPQMADGGGYTTSLLLLNTSTRAESGTLEILDNNGTALVVNQLGGTAGSSFRYLIPVGGVFRFQTDGSPVNTQVGWVRLTPDYLSSTPVGAGVFSFTPENAMVSESGIPAANSTTHARVYVDISNNHNTGLAIANVDTAASNITITAYHTDGTTGAGTSPGQLHLAIGGHDAKFADQFISGLPAGFTGLLDISSTSPFAALTVRSLMNENNDFLMATFPVADINRTPPLPIIFPQIADGGGYLTQFVLLSPGAASNATLNIYGEDGNPLMLGK